MAQDFYKHLNLLFKVLDAQCTVHPATLVGGIVIAMLLGVAIGASL